MVQKKKIVSESQLDYLIKDRKHLMDELRVEIKNNHIIKKKLKTYERVIGFSIALNIVWAIIVLL